MYSGVNISAILCRHSVVSALEVAAEDAAAELDATAAAAAAEGWPKKENSAVAAPELDAADVSVAASAIGCPGASGCPGK